MTIAEQTRPLRAGLGRSDRYTDLRGEQYPLAAMSGAEALLVLALLAASSANSCCSPPDPPATSETLRSRSTVESRRRARPSGCAPRRFTAR